MRQQNLMFIYNSDGTKCVDLLRMKRAPFFQLCDLFRQRVLLKDIIHSSIEEQVAMFLHVVGHNQRFRCINLTFRRSVETITRYFHQVLYAIGELRDEMIQPPSTAVPTKILHSRRWNPYFKDCVGAIDGTHVLARVPSAQKAAFLGRKHTTTQNVLAAVDFDLGFTYVLAGWEGSAHDALILADALRRDDGLTVPQVVMAHVGGVAGQPTDPEVQVVMDMGAGGNNAGNPRLQWTAVMSGFVLRRFVDLVGQGVETDKGFKETHLNSVARDLSDFSGVEVSGTQVYNHLRKWRARWVKICNLKSLSGALWDDDVYMISLEKEHYNGHVKDHPKDADFLNVPLENYMPMQIIFGSGVATRRFAMGSNEPLGDASDQQAPIDLDADEKKPEDIAKGEGSDGKAKGEGASTGKRKRVAEDDGGLFVGLTDAIWGFTAAVTQATHAEAVPGVYAAAMEHGGFSREALMFALGHLTEHKAIGLVFVEMIHEDRDLWLRMFWRSTTSSRWTLRWSDPRNLAVLDAYCCRSVTIPHASSDRMTEQG
ncbi:hypothetical protein ACP4OV_007913 [Aristida adscensionis]